MNTNPFGIEKDALTTGEVARICNVAARTVSKWVDSGRLEGYRIPGSKDRRIHVTALEQFMRSHGIPFRGCATGAARTRILVVDADRTAAVTLKDVLEGMGTCDVSVAHDVLSAGFECGRATPDVIVFDGSAGDPAAFTAGVRTRPGFGGVRVVASGTNLPDDERQLLRAGCAGALHKPYSVRALVEAVGLDVVARQATCAA
jgi:excisionase family DNA binding protein